MGYGKLMEIYKDIGLPGTVAKKSASRRWPGTHAIGHTRMATESRGDHDGAHPFSTGARPVPGPQRLAVSNHNNLRRRLKREGKTFETENDTEVAAAYLTWRMSQGATLGEALEAGLDDLDGFFTFVVGTKDGFARGARPDRLQAGGHGGDRRLCRLRLGISARSPTCRASRRRGSGSRSPPPSISGSLH